MSPLQLFHNARNVERIRTTVVTWQKDQSGNKESSIVVYRPHKLARPSCLKYKISCRKSSCCKLGQNVFTIRGMIRAFYDEIKSHHVLLDIWRHVQKIKRDSIACVGTNDRLLSEVDHALSEARCRKTFAYLPAKWLLLMRVSIASADT